MKTIITAFTFFLVQLIAAQTPFEQGMGKAMKLWGEDKPSEATALLERIASAEKNNWLPNYYIALINTTEAFNPKNRERINALLTQAQSVLDTEMAKDPKNVELIVLQALIHTAWIAYDPMTNGMRLSATVMELYAKAIALDPKNPRAVFGKAEFEIGGAQWTGADVKALCKDVERATVLFATEKPSQPFAPSWGADRAQEQLAKCK
ncbi:MAG: hypothetical protein RLZZ500_1125 [Bacteroidota bacterium]|jgi:hypothetical protein